MHPRLGVLSVLIWAALPLYSVAFAAQNQIDVLYLKIEQPHRATLSRLDPIPEDIGWQGAALGVEDNNTTGRFMGYAVSLEVAIYPQGDVAGAKATLTQSDADFVLLDMPAEEITALVTAYPDRLFFNTSAYDDMLRGAGCASNLLHTIPSYAMRADALMQYLVKKQWTDIVLVEGNTPEDSAFAEALRRAARKFQLRINSERKWIFDADMRRNASAEVPLFTQDFGSYDVMLVADEKNDFARYIAYNTWQPRPIMGADGLMARGWSHVVEQWGAAQLQSRFFDVAGRRMRDEDYAAWAALRSIDEAYIRTNMGDRNAIYSYLLGETFSLGGFKGRPLSYRNWNGQLRQPIALVSASATIANAPFEAFLHARNELDSLGYDLPESECTAFGDL